MCCEGQRTRGTVSKEKLEMECCWVRTPESLRMETIGKPGVEKRGERRSPHGIYTFPRGGQKLRQVRKPSPATVQFRGVSGFFSYKTSKARPMEEGQLRDLWSVIGEKSREAKTPSTRKPSTCSPEPLIRSFPG